MRAHVLVAAGLFLSGCAKGGPPGFDDVSDDSDAEVADTSTADTRVEAATDAPHDGAMTDTSMSTDGSPVDAPLDMGSGVDATDAVDVGDVGIPPVDAPVDMGVDAAVDTGVDVRPDVRIDTGTDAPALPADIGVYSYQAIPAYNIINPPAVAWQPAGAYALIPSATDTVWRYTATTRMVTQVASVGTTISWRAITFTPDGTKAILLGNSGSTSPTGHIYVWDDATSVLTEMSTAQFAGGTYESITWSADGHATLLGSRTNTGGTYIAYLWAFDVSAGTSGVHAYPTSAGCQDLAAATDSFDAPATAVVCGVNGVDLFHIDGGGVLVRAGTGAGNTSRISARPQHDYALAVGWSGARVYRFQQGIWTAGFSSPSLPGIFALGFSTDGRRALILGGMGPGSVGEVYEFRHDLLDQVDLTDVSIPGFASPPYAADSGTRLNAVAWRPGCEAGLIVGGENTFTAQRGLVIRFSVDNGIACPN